MTAGGGPARSSQTGGGGGRARTSPFDAAVPGPGRGARGGCTTALRDGGGGGAREGGGTAEAGGGGGKRRGWAPAAAQQGRPETEEAVGPGSAYQDRRGASQKLATLRIGTEARGRVGGGRVEEEAVEAAVFPTAATRPLPPAASLPK